jgi:4'-phosphopantetheinyl transferase
LPKPTLWRVRRWRMIRCLIDKNCRRTTTRALRRRPHPPRFPLLRPASAYGGAGFRARAPKSPPSPRSSPPPSARARSGFGTVELRDRWIAGRGALRALLGLALGIAPSAVEIRRGVRGRPELAEAGAGIDFNVSHTRGVALIGIARGLPANTRIGVDIERLDRDVGVDRLARKFLTATERASLADLDLRERRERFVRYWTCKEAMSKATGDGLIAPFGRLVVELSETPRLVDGPPPYVPSQWTLRRVPVPAAWAATIAIWHHP